MNVLLLNFISVLYPLLLMISMYTCIELHGRNFRPIVILWKPFGRCFSKIRRNWSVTDSIVHAYATLLLLSFAILNHNVYLLLQSTDVYNSTGKVYTYVLVNRPSLHVYSTECIPYLIIVLTLMFFLGVCPTALLCIYSIKMFRRKFNNCCSHRIQIALNTFVETFQGTFKDGLNGTRDYRVLSEVTLITVMFTTIVASFGDVFDIYIIFTYNVASLVLSSFLIAYVRPCISFLTNLSLSFHMMWVATAFYIVACWNGNTSFTMSTLAMLFAAIFLVPHIIMISWAMYKLLHKINCIRCSVAAFKTRTAGRQLRERALGVQQSYKSLLPDRLENSRDYRELITSVSHAK